MRNIKNNFCRLETPFEKGGNINWENLHPTPQFKRDEYISLCGEWQLAVKKGDDKTLLGNITVPFAPESTISGICRQLKKGEQYVYTRTFTLPDFFCGKRAILHFGAVDQIAQVYINGIFAHENIGGYLPFEVDITPFLKTENTLTVIVTDDLDTDLPYGKQCRKRGGMWYTPISGIWQPVWLEAVCQNSVKSISITPTLSQITIDVSGGEDQKVILFEGKRYTFSDKSFTLKIENPINWTPETPHLYYFTLLCGEDKVDSYFALRTVSIENKNGIPYICLNGKPRFFHGLLDQGYFSDGIYTPATPKGYIYDIQTMKELGFNMLRKHIKIEPELFYYYCDKYGMIVFQDMVNSGKYSFLLDTALPTIGIKRGLSRRASKYRAHIFKHSCYATLNTLYNHPCVIGYTIFNEGWGQFDAKRLYFLMKSFDNTRIYDTASGWFKTKHTDVISEHVYFKKVRLKHSGKKPLTLSEFGGYSCKIAGHSFNTNQNYGYKYFENSEDFSDALVSLYRDEIIPEIEKGLCATVLTQVSDVEDETNGLVTYDRRIIKVKPEDIKAVSDQIYRAFDERLKKYD